MKPGFRFIPSGSDYYDGANAKLHRMILNSPQLLLAHSFKFERDTALSNLLKFLKKGCPPIADEGRVCKVISQVHSSVQFFRLFITHIKNETKKDKNVVNKNIFIQDGIHKVMRDVINAVCSIDYTNNAVVCSGVEFIVLDCVWFFTNLFVSQTEIELVLPFIIEENIPHFLTKLFVETKNFSIKLQCIWALRNFTSFDDKCRKLFLQTEFSKDKNDGCLFDKLLVHILEVVASEKPNVSLVNLDSGEVSSGLQKTWEKTMLKLFEQSMEFIRNMLNYRELGFLKSHPTNTSYAHMFLPLFHAFLKGCKNDHLLRQSCLIMSLLITANLKNDGDRENTETNNLTLRLFDEDLIRYTIPLLLHKNKEVHISAVRFLGDVLFGPRANIKRLIGMGVVGPIYELSKSSDSNVRKEACWALSNCASVGDECLMTIVDAPVFFAPLNGSDKNQKVERIQGLTWMLRLFAAEINSSVKFEIAWFLLNVAKGGKPSVTVELLNAEAHILMAKFLEEHVDSMVNNHLLVMDTVEYFGEIANYQNFPKDQLSCLYATTE